MFFFFSHDRRFIIKTLKSAELPFFVKVLSSFFNHMVAHPDTLLPRFYGLYKLKLPKLSVVRVVVMNNLFYTPLRQDMMFDLKGSTIKRWVTDEEKANGTSVLKDLNFSCEGLGKQPPGVPVIKNKIYLGGGEVDKRHGEFMHQMKQDANWLRDHNIMDYSLLLGICSDCTKCAACGVSNCAKCGPTDLTPRTASAAAGAGEQDHVVSKWEVDLGGLRARRQDGEPRKEVYFMGVIDILQEYDIKKKLEHELKAHKQIQKGGDPNAISAVKSSVYAKRFVDYLGRNILA
jgi:1-phosphatidylinositol-4-phosphate 5-kinase